MRQQFFSCVVVGSHGRLDAWMGAVGMIPHIEAPGRPQRRGPGFKGNWALPQAPRARVLVVEDEEVIRDSMGPLLQEDGYDVSFAENGREALTRLYTETPPDLIVLDLRMPVMDGWEFRAVQKDDPKLGRIPVVAISADGSPQAAAISAQAYLRKPVGARELLATVERVLLENQLQVNARVHETERLAALGRLAAGVGHEINNPLTFVMLNINQALEKLQSRVLAFDASFGVPLPEFELAEVKDRQLEVIEMLEDCQVGGQRIRATVSNLQRLSRQAEDQRESVDLHRLIDQSISMVWNQIRHRAQLIKAYGAVPPITANGHALGQVFLNLLLNAAQAMPEGEAEQHEIRVSTQVVAGENGAEVVVEVSDSGTGIAPEDLPRLFEPFFTTKPIGQGTGLGLSVSRQTVADHSGRITVESELGKGTVFRVVLPVGQASSPSEVVPSSGVSLEDHIAPLFRGRLLVIDDEPLIGRAIRTALNNEHEVFVVQRASEAVTLLEHGETFDLMLCDVVMPDLSGPEFYAVLKERWPPLVSRLVFMTGGAFTPGTVEFIERVPTRVLSKPFKVDLLKRLVRERIRGNA